MNGYPVFVSLRRLAPFGLLVLSLAGLGACATLKDGDLQVDRLFAARKFERTEDNSAAGSYLAARYAGSQRDAKAAALYFARALEADPNNPVILDSAFLLELSAGNVAQSVALAERISTLDPGARMARLVRAADFIRSGSFAAAGAELDASPPRSMADVVWVSLRAWAYAGAGDHEAALELLGRPEVTNTVGAFAVYHSALIQDLAGDSESASKSYADALEAIGGQSVRLAVAFADFLIRNGQSEDAVNLLAASLSQNGPHPSLLAARQAALDTNVKRERMVRNAADGAAEALFGIAGAIAGEGAVEVPIAYLQLALHLRPDFDAGWALMGEFREEQRQWDDAARMFAKVGPDSELATAAVTSIAINLARLDRSAEAVKLLRRQLAKDADNVDLMVALGDQHRMREEFDQAEALYARAIDTAGGLQPHHWQIVYSRAIALERAGRWAEAEPLFEKALEFRPDEPQILNYLGYSWIDRGENLDLALELIYKAVDQRPDDGFIVDSLGWAYFKLGDFETATYYLERAVELEPQDPTINEHLGDAYWRVGRYKEARFQWSHALAFADEKHKDLRRLLKSKIKSGLPPASEGQTQGGA